MTNGAHARPMSESDKKLQRLFAPISDVLNRAHGAQRKLIPEDGPRLKLIKVSLVAIGGYITKHESAKENSSLEKDMWDYVSRRYWPQSSKEDKRVSGKKLRDMYAKIAGRDSVPKTTNPKPATKPENNGTSEAKKEVKKEASSDPSPAQDTKPKAPSPLQDTKPKAPSPAAAKEEDKMDVDTKSPA